ncbi:hypothetical protein K435DRAFT_842317 [Dendrothele bispora CBS 962.96]|uniref:C2H2-type domain-containing protein n=1 Tax=Dendrothele bispora (strain CBS 962.96) TaxID=1314807 RepID=A0A4S8LG81_DENBC|nr:hypothetical protein K435DRAFT_842317 [Dendrothele bispora CBS 962.96]
MLDLPRSVFDPNPIVDHVDEKLSATHLYCHQQHTVQIIQLVEAPPPPRRVLNNDSYYSSSSSSDYSESEEDVDEDEDCSSYCSSEDDAEAMPSPQQQLHSKPISLDASSSTETYSIRMKRILAWRENFSAHMSATLSEPSLSTSLKRKINIDDHDDAMSHSSKRSRSESSHSGASSLGALSCPACDASFDTRQDLRQHGREALAGANEACFTAVDYAFE